MANNGTKHDCEVSTLNKLKRIIIFFQNNPSKFFSKSFISEELLVNPRDIDKYLELLLYLNIISQTKLIDKNKAIKIFYGLEKLPKWYNRK